MNQKHQSTEHQKLTIKSFWDKHPTLYIFECAVFAIVETIFLALSIRAIIEGIKVPTCPDVKFSKFHRSSILLLTAVHFYEVARLIYLIRQKYKRVTQPKPSIRRCFFLNCYSCVAIFAWVYSQSCYFVLRDLCNRSLSQRWL